MPRAVAGDATGDDLAPLGQEVAERACVLVVDQHGLVGAEAADLSPAHSPATEGASSALPFAAAPLATTVLHHHLRRLLAEILLIGAFDLPFLALEPPGWTRRCGRSVLSLPD